MMVEHHGLIEAADLARLGTATLYEAARRHCFLPARIRPSWPGPVLVGRALPVRTGAGDNLAIHRALAVARPGEVLVVDGRQAACGYWGEVLTVAAQQRGLSGLVIDGGVRDTARLQALRFPVFSSAIALQTTVKEDPGVVGDPIDIGGVTVARGDIVVADGDGVVVLPAAELDRIAGSAREREAAEQRYLARIMQGELTLDIYGLRSVPSVLEDAGEITP
jgi:4-hydroxy-4-methyl-2-oxoglutarate aldolase